MDLVKILVDDGGDKRESPKWCLAVRNDGSKRTLCTGEAFGLGESTAIFKEKKANKGITCPKCIEIIKFYKSINL
jgi:hypothetical protein